MFERYTEKARRVIFFARYEASQFGAEAITSEHILLGLLREDKDLVARFLPAGSAAVRQKVAASSSVRPSVPNHVDLPLAQEAKQVLAFAAEEAERLEQRHIGTEHLLLGLLRAEQSAVAALLHEFGLRLNAVREELRNHPPTAQPVTQKLILEEASSGRVEPLDRDERWLGEVAAAGVARGLFTQAEFEDELARVAALRQFRADAEALLRLLAAKGLVEPDGLAALAFELRDERELAEFIVRLHN